MNSLRSPVKLRTAELTAANSALLHASNTDPLTGLSNRRFIQAQLEKLQAQRSRQQPQTQSMGLLLLDIDHFKTINDRWSHQAGDLVLQQLAQLLRQQVRDIDRIARWGGEEFALLLPQTDLTHAVEICQRIRLAIAALDFSADVPGLQVTASFGVAQHDDVGSYDKLLSRADQLLYQAKAQGRNRVCS